MLALETELYDGPKRVEAAEALERALSASTARLIDYEMNTEFAAAAFRDTLARAYLALGRRHDAARVLEDLVNSGIERVHFPFPVVYVRALFTLGNLKMELGDVLAGREMLTRFLDHWGASDWPLQEVREARKLVEPVRTP